MFEALLGFEPRTFVGTRAISTSLMVKVWLAGNPVQIMGIACLPRAAELLSLMAKSIWLTEMRSILRLASCRSMTRVKLVTSYVNQKQLSKWMTALCWWSDFFFCSSKWRADDHIFQIFVFVLKPGMMVPIEEYSWEWVQATHKMAFPLSIRYVLTILKEIQNIQHPQSLTLSTSKFIQTQYIYIHSIYLHLCPCEGTTCTLAIFVLLYMFISKSMPKSMSISIPIYQCLCMYNHVCIWMNIYIYTYIYITPKHTYMFYICIQYV